MLIHLHNHTKYSLLDSISKTEDIIQKLKNIGSTAFAVTDHGNCYNSPELYRELTKNNIKYIYGCEMYICGNIEVKEKDSKYYHLVVLAKNETGRININKMISIANIKGFYYKPRIDFNILKQYSDGIIVLSACMAGEIQKNIMEHNYHLTKEIAEKYKKVFGDDYYLEIQSHNDIQTKSNNAKIIQLAKELNIKYVVTTDSHYVNKEDQIFHDIFVKIGTQREAGETYNDCYIQSEEEVREYLGDYLSSDVIDLAINNTVEIADKCNVTLPLSSPIIPPVEIPDEFDNERTFLKHLCNQGWVRHGINKLPNDIKNQYLDRLKYEIEAIIKMGFESYFLMVDDFCKQAKRKGLGRGSCGGSLVAFLLDITKVDPIKYDLYFERFIDVSALDELEKGNITKKELKMPDIDTDFGKQSRIEVKQYLSHKHGEDKVACIGSFQYIWAKGAIKDIGKVLNIPFETTNAMTKRIEDETIGQVLEFGILDDYKEQYPDLFKYAEKLAGLPKSFSRHPCGVICCENELDYYAPYLNNDGEITLTLDMHSCEDLGLVKADFLGLRTVDTIYDTLEIIGETEDYIDPNKIDLNDNNIYELLRSAETEACFQIESQGMKETLKKIQPTCIEDVIAIIALYRPGAKGYIDDYANRKNGITPIEYLHQDLEPILNKTYGCLVYQEQLIRIGRLAGIKNPDKLRKATGKKDLELLASLEVEVRNGLMNRGWTQEQVNTLWEDMLKFARYAFNKSHAAGYALLVIITAKLKCYHPKEYMCSVINSFMGKIDRIAQYVIEAKRMNIKIEMPNWKQVRTLCTIENDRFLLGLGVIKYLGSKISNELTKIKDNEYTTFIDMLMALSKLEMNIRQITILIALDFFKDFGNNQKLLTIKDEYAKRLHGKKLISKTVLKRRLELIEFEKTVPNEVMDIQEQLVIEHEFLGYCNSVYDCEDNFYIITEINENYTPIVTVYSLSTGLIKKLKIFKRDLYLNNERLINEYDIIQITNTYMKEKNFKDEETDEWKGSGMFEEILKNYSLIKKYVSKKEAKEVS